MKLLLVLALTSAMSVASPQMDEDYSLRRLAVGVVGLSKATVHGETVASALEEWLGANPRFEVIPAANQALRAALSQSDPALFLDDKIQVGAVEGILSSLSTYSLHAVLLASIQRSGEKYQLRLGLIQARSLSLVAQATIAVEDAQLLDHFAMAARIGLAQLEKDIPFQASILSREGYRFVLDRGAGAFRVGQQVRVFTLESWQGAPVFEETGVVQINRVDRSLAFAKLVADRRPREVRAGNKVLVGESLEVAAIRSSGEDGGRGLASLSTREVVARRGTIGSLALTLGPNFTQLNQSTASGELTSTGNTLYPGGVIEGEVLITPRVFFDLSFGVSSASVSNVADTSGASLGSSLSRVRGQLGYRFGDSRARPSLDVKAGYAKTKYGMDTAAEPFQFPTRTYSSLLLGTAARLPLTDDFAVGLEANLPFFQSVTETPLTSGAEVTGTSGLDVSLRFSYLLTAQMDLEMKLAMQSHGAEFSGQGTRTTPLSSSSETQKSLLVGVSYFF